MYSMIVCCWCPDCVLRTFQRLRGSVHVAKTQGNGQLCEKTSMKGEGVDEEVSLSRCSQHHVVFMGLRERACFEPVRRICRNQGSCCSFRIQQRGDHFFRVLA